VRAQRRAQRAMQRSAVAAETESAYATAEGYETGMLQQEVTLPPALFRRRRF